MSPLFFSSSKYSDGLTILLISFFTALICEAISYILIYRTSSYKSLKSSIDRASKKLETMKTDNPTSKKTSKVKKLDRVELNLKESNRDLSLFKFKPGAVVAFVLFVVFGFLNNLFEGKTVTKLPFVLFRIVQKMSHRGLQGEDYTDCSMAFLYFLYFSEGKVFSHHKIISVLKVVKEPKNGYNFLTEITVRRHDDKEYTFSEADFRRLNIHDIEDMYLLKKQEKLENLSGDLQYDLINSILIFIRQIVIKARVEDVHLGAESYQTRLNLTEPKLHIPGLSNKKPYQFINKPFGVVDMIRESIKFMAYEEIHKFGDQTLLLVQNQLTIVLNNYNKGKRESWLKHMTWSRNDAKHAGKFLARIEKRLKFGDTLRRFESYVGGRAPIPNILTFRRPE